MKKFAPYLLASAFALPAFALSGATVNAQSPSPSSEQNCEGHRRGGPDGQHAHHGHHGRGGHGHHGGPRGHHDPAQRVEHRASMLTAILNLDARQQTEVRRILTAEATEIATLRAQPRSDSSRETMRALHERTKSSIAAVLSPSQRATMDRIEAVRSAERTRREAERAARPARPTPSTPAAQSVPATRLTPATPAPSR